MVNCKNCGAPLSLNDAFCPHCGTPNPEAQEHLKKLRQLDEQFENASLSFTRIRSEDSFMSLIPAMSSSVSCR